MTRLCSKFIKTVLHKIRMAQHDDFTIAEHFRKLGARIGEDTRLEIRKLSTEPYLITIGNHCTVAQNVVFLAHDGATWVFTDEFPSIQKFGTIQVCDNCFIGYGSVIMGNVTIGPNTIIGAGSIVTKSIPANVVAAGNPARIICSIDEYKKKALRIWKEQKPAGYFEGIQEGVKYPPSYIQQLKRRDSQLLKEHLSKTLRQKNTAIEFDRNRQKMTI